MSNNTLLAEIGDSLLVSQLSEVYNALLTLPDEEARLRLIVELSEACGSDLTDPSNIKLLSVEQQSKVKDRLTAHRIDEIGTTSASSVDGQSTTTPDTVEETSPEVDPAPVEENQVIPEVQPQISVPGPTSPLVQVTCANDTQAARDMYMHMANGRRSQWVTDFLSIYQPLLALLIVGFGCCFMWQVAFGAPSQDNQHIGTLIGLIGGTMITAVLGFYFGGSPKSSNGNNRQSDPPSDNKTM